MVLGTKLAPFPYLLWKAIFHWRRKYYSFLQTQTNSSKKAIAKGFKASSCSLCIMHINSSSDIFGG